MEQFKLPPVLERYELKFVISPDMIEPISRFASAYCSMDKYSAFSDDGFYYVNNLYLDSPNFTFLKNRLDEVQNRFNMRIRSYGPDPGSLYFPEIKAKNSEIIKKYRSVYEGYDLREAILEPNALKGWSENRNSINLAMFQRLAQTYNVEPKVLTQYRRLAYVSDTEEYARITFDIDLRYMAEEQFQVHVIEDAMAHYDHNLNFDPGASVILELKCYCAFVPLWMVDLIRAFDLCRRGFSKYGTGAAALFEQFAAANMDRVGAFPINSF